MYISIEDKVRERIRGMERGSVFFPETFFDLGSETACRKALERMSAKGEIMFMARGIYAYPEKSELFGDVPPSMEQIAKAIAQRDHARIIATGQYAARVLGFTTQIPLQVTYLTDGMPRKISIGKRSWRWVVIWRPLLRSSTWCLRTRRTCSPFSKPKRTSCGLPLTVV